MQFLEQAVAFLLATVLVVPLFRRIGLGAVLGYLVSGMLIGPWGLGLIGHVEATLHFAEFGVVLLLFLIGLELQPTRLWALRRPVFGLGAAQVLATAIAILATGVALGLPWQTALTIGIALAMSSTAMILASLAERRQLTRRHGRDAFAILLFQDLAVIPLLAVLPLLALAHGEKPATDWIAALKGLAVIVAVIAGSRLLGRPILRFIATHGGREVFTAAALLVVVGAALLMERIGVSMSLGAFLAGVLLADSEFRHELEADIEPFKGLLLGLFFVAVGMSANVGLLAQQPIIVIGIALALIAAKAVIVYVIGLVAGAGNDSSQRLAVVLSAGGEFAFVIFGLAGGLGIIAQDLAELLVLAVTLSMLVAPLLISGHEKVLDRAQALRAPPEFDTITEPGNAVVIAGYGRFGQIVSRVLRMCGIAFTALDASSEQVDFVRRYGNKIYYGDASRLELLHAAKLEHAKVFVLAIDDVESSVRTAALVRRHFPQLPILARARNRVHYFRLRELGISAIHRETFPASLDVARQALLRLGFGIAAAEHAVALFKAHDEEQLARQGAVQHDEAQLIELAKHATEQLRELFEADAARPLARLPQGAAPDATHPG